MVTAMNNCCCCLENINKRDNSITSCGHHMHTSCLVHWIRTGKHTCPLCREALIEIPLVSPEGSVITPEFLISVRRNLLIDHYNFTSEEVDIVESNEAKGIFSGDEINYILEENNDDMIESEMAVDGAET